MKLGSFWKVPLLRTKAVRRETSPSFGSVVNVAMNHLLSGKAVSGPRSTSWRFCPRKEGSSANPATGTVTIPPISPPMPSVAPSRKRLRGNRSPGRGFGMPASPVVVGGGPVHSRTSAATGGTCRRISVVAARAHRKPKTTAITAPAVAIHTGLTISPTRMTAMPTANPSGQMVGDGPWSDGPGVIPSSLIRS